MHISIVFPNRGRFIASLFVILAGLDVANIRFVAAIRLRFLRTAISAYAETDRTFDPRSRRTLLLAASCYRLKISGFSRCR